MPAGVFLTKGNTSTYSFVIAASRAYGNNLKLVDTSPINTYAVYSGDVNQDGSINAIDISIVDNDVLNFVTGYRRTDVTGNNVVDAADLTIVDNNAFNFVSKVTPP